MNTENDIFMNDLQQIAEDKAIEWQEYSGKTICVSGATGLIGKTLVQAVCYANQKYHLKCKIIALVRNEKKAREIFAKEIANQPDSISFIISDICDKVTVEDPVDYIFHCASQTSSKSFVEQPVETTKTALHGTENMLELAVEKKCSGFLYLSSMEVYGTPLTDEKIYENRELNMSTTSVRNCYPIGKCMCENLCVSYAAEYGVPAKIMRLTQTFGPGVDYNDGRVFAEFARCVIEKKPIVLHTMGETKRNYLYTADAVRAMLIVMQKGEAQKAYNAANEDTYISIYDMALLVAEKCANGKIEVRRKVEQDITKLGYAPVLKMNLSTERLQELGWKPYYDLEEMFSRTINTMKK